MLDLIAVKKGLVDNVKDQTKKGKKKQLVPN